MSQVMTLCDLAGPRWSLLGTERRLSILSGSSFVVCSCNWRQVDGFLGGERDYTKLKGDTGPLVYPAGFLYVYSAIKFLTGGEVFPAQVRSRWTSQDSFSTFFSFYFPFVFFHQDVSRLTIFKILWSVFFLCLIFSCAIEGFLISLLSNIYTIAESYMCEYSAHGMRDTLYNLRLRIVPL